MPDMVLCGTSVPMYFEVPVLFKQPPQPESKHIFLAIPSELVGGYPVAQLKKIKLIGYRQKTSVF